METQNQLDLDWRVDERDWTAVNLLVEELRQELAERRNHLLLRIAAWFIAVRVFKRVETEKMILKEPLQRDLKYHRANLAFLRGWGAVLLVELEQHQEIDPTKVGIRYNDFSAMVEELTIAERERYGDMTTERRSEILKDVFGEQT